MKCTQCCLVGVVCLLAAAAVLPLPSHADGTNDGGGDPEASLLELNERVLEAYILNNNVEPLREIAVDDFFVVTPAGVESRERVLETAGNLDIESISIENTEIHQYGTTAILAGTVIAEGQIGGRPMPPITYLSVYVDEGGQWQLVARSITPLFAPPQR